MIKVASPKNLAQKLCQFLLKICYKIANFCSAFYGGHLGQFRIHFLQNANIKIFLGKISFFRVKKSLNKNYEVGKLTVIKFCAVIFLFYRSFLIKSLIRFHMKKFAKKIFKVEDFFENN